MSKMDSMMKARIKAGLSELRNRIQKDGDKDGELVKITVDTLLAGQEAVNYRVAKLFTDAISDQDFIQMLFRLGLKNAMELVKMAAQKNGIRL